MTVRTIKPAPATTSTAAAAPAPTMDMNAMMAMMQKMLMQQATPTTSAPVAAKVSNEADLVSAAIIAAGGKVTRVGKSGRTPKGFAKAWVDMTVGNVRIQGNAFLKS